MWANNVASNFQGFSDQSYMLTASKAGEQYLTFIWDQTPHVYSTSAQTIWNGVGSNNLTLPAGLVANPLKGNVNLNAGAADRRHSALLVRDRSRHPAQHRGGHLSRDRPLDVLGCRTANYSYMTRTGTQPAGIVEMNGFQPTNVPAPVDDSTQNFGAKGEYIGTSLWGQKFTFKAAYNGSIYTDNISSYTVQNPGSQRPPPQACRRLYETHSSGGGYGELRQRADVDLAQQSNERLQHNDVGGSAVQQPLRRHHQLRDDDAKRGVSCR